MTLRHRIRRCLSNAVACLLLCCLSTAIAQEPPIADLVLSPDHKSLVAVGQQGVEVYSWPELEFQKNLDDRARHRIRATFSPDGQRLAIGGGRPARAGQLTVFDWPGRRIAFDWEAHGDTIQSLAWEGPEALWTASLDRKLARRPIADKTPNAELEGHSRGLRALAYSQRLGQLYSASDDATIRVWDAAEAQLIRRLPQHTGPVLDLSINDPQTQQPWLASASEDRTVRFWQPAIGRLVRFVRLESIPQRVAWLDDDRVVAACRDGRLRVIDVPTAQVAATYEGVTGWAYALVVDRKSQLVAVGGSRHQLRRIDLSKKPTNEDSGIR